MDNTTPNSGSLAELRPAKFPSPDADFFSAFLPEILFALVVWAVAALAHYHFAKLVSKLEDPADKTKSTQESWHKRGTLEALEKLDLADPDFAEKTWSYVRAYLVKELGNPMFPNMTAAEAVKATESMEGFVPFAYFARELEYSASRNDAASNLSLKESATTFINSR